MEDIEHYDIPVYNFPYDVEEDDEETIQDNSELRVRDIKPPLASLRTLTRAAGSPSVRHHWLRGGDRDRRPACSRADLPLGYRRGRQPQAL